MKLILKQFKELMTERKKHVFLFMILGVLASATVYYVTMVLPKIIMDLMVVSQLNTLYIQLTIYSVVLAVSAIILNISDAVTQTAFQEVRLLQFARFHKKYMEIDYEHIEDARFQDETETSSRALSGNHMGFEHVYTLTYQILKSLCIIVIASVLIIGLSYWILVISVITAIVAMLVKGMIAKNEYKKKEMVSHEARKQRYFYDTSYNFNYGKDLRVYQLEDDFNKKYKKASAGYLSVLKKLYHFEFYASLLELIPLLLQDGIAFFFIVYAYYQEMIGLSDVAMYLSAVVILSTYLRQFGLDFGSLKADLNYVKDYYKFIESNKYTKYANDLKPLTGDITIVFEHVDFKYPNTENYIFKDLNFTITAKEKLAIVGINGAGKTTLIKLICGLFYPTDGRILINGHDVRLFEKKQYQDMFSVVFQDYKIFAASVLENVMGTDQDTNRAIKALDQAGMTEKITSLPNGYHQQLLRVIDENGVDLSGGEKQKIAIARALYKDASVMILDEPTAALDAIAEEKIYQQFADMTKDKTTIFISHRLASTRFCDKIALFDKGLIEYGTHQELMDKKGLYFQMFEVQGKYYKAGV